MNQRFRIRYTFREREIAIVVIAVDEAAARRHFRHHHPHCVIDRIERISARPLASRAAPATGTMPVRPRRGPTDETERARLRAEARTLADALRDVLFPEAA